MSFSIDEKTVGRIARAFWRRIEPYKNDYEKELPVPLPIAFQAHMHTALSLIEDNFPKGLGASVDADSPGKCGVLIMFERPLTSEELRRLHEMFS